MDGLDEKEVEYLWELEKKTQDVANGVPQDGQMMRENLHDAVKFVQPNSDDYFGMDEFEEEELDGLWSLEKKMQNDAISAPRDEQLFEGVPDTAKDNITYEADMTKDLKAGRKVEDAKSGKVPELQAGEVDDAEFLHFVKSLEKDARAALGQYRFNKSTTNEVESAGFPPANNSSSSPTSVNKQVDEPAVAIVISSQESLVEVPAPRSRRRLRFLEPSYIQELAASVEASEDWNESGFALDCNTIPMAAQPPGADAHANPTKIRILTRGRVHARRGWTTADHLEP